MQVLSVVAVAVREGDDVVVGLFEVVLAVRLLEVRHRWRVCEVGVVSRGKEEEGASSALMWFPIGLESYRGD